MSADSLPREKHRPSCATKPWNQGAGAECSCDSWREEAALVAHARVCRWIKGQQVDYDVQACCRCRHMAEPKPARASGTEPQR